MPAPYSAETAEAVIASTPTALASLNPPSGAAKALCCVMIFLPPCAQRIARCFRWMLPPYRTAWLGSGHDARHVVFKHLGMNVAGTESSRGATLPVVVPRPVK